MLRMQHAQLALLLMEDRSSSAPKIQFPSEDREVQRRLERIRDSLLRHSPEPRAEVRPARPHGA